MDNAAPVLSGVSDKARRTAIRYFDENAFQYDAKRRGTAKWDGEHRKVKKFLNGLPECTSMLDIPCGTGRFFPLYSELDFNVVGMDISSDMIDEAKKRTGPNINVKTGSIFNIETDKIFDVVLCIRFLNLIESDDLKRAFAEMQRVSKKIIFTLRIKRKNPTRHYHSPHSIELIKESLLPGWKINRNDPVHQEDYRMVEIIKCDL